MPTAEPGWRRGVAAWWCGGESWARPASRAGTSCPRSARRAAMRPLWEAFVFPFRDQMSRVSALVAAGVIGELLEIQSCVHFAMTHPESNIRMSAALAGGALNDVGCYPVRLARDLFGAEHTSAWAS